MLCKLSKIIFILFIFYLGWFLNVFFIIPRMPLILGLSMIALLVLYNLHPLRRHSIIITRPVLIWLVFSFYALLSGVFISYNKNHLIDSLFTYVQILAMMVYIINVSIIEKDYKFFVKSYLFYSIIYMITMLLWGVEIKGRLTLSVTSNPNGDALTLVYGIFCVLFLCDFKKITHVILSFLLTGIFIYTIMLTGSRKSFLAAVLLLLCWFIFTFKGYQRIFSTKKKIFTLFITIILIITIIYKLQPFFVNSSLYWRLSERGFLISNDKARSGMYIEALKFFYDNPLFGIGFNHYRLLSIYHTYSHSTYAEILSTTGLIGSIIYFIPYLIIIYNLYSIYKKQKATVASLKSIQFLVLMFVMLVLGTGVIHFYNIRDNIMFALMISFYYIEELKLKQHTYIINSK